jgi:hypothetical protein
MDQVVAMVSSSSAAKTLIDLPNDILTSIADFINDESDLFVGRDLFQFILTHSRCLEAAERRIKKHQRCIKKYGFVTIDPNEDVLRYENTYETCAHLLVAACQDPKVFTYLRHLEYNAPERSGREIKVGTGRPALVQAPDGPCYARWTKYARDIFEELKPYDTYIGFKDWETRLWTVEAGIGLAAILYKTSLLSLKLAGHPSYWEDAFSTDIYSWKGLPPHYLSVKRLVLHLTPEPDIDLWCYIFENAGSLKVQELEVHCHHKSLESDYLNVSRSLNWAFDGDFGSFFTAIPNVKLIGYKELTRLPLERNYLERLEIINGVDNKLRVSEILDDPHYDDNISRRSTQGFKTPQCSFIAKNTLQIVIGRIGNTRGPLEPIVWPPRRLRQVVKKQTTSPPNTHIKGPSKPAPAATMASPVTGVAPTVGQGSGTTSTGVAPVATASAKRRQRMKRSREKKEEEKSLLACGLGLADQARRKQAQSIEDENARMNRVLSGIPIW